MTRDFADPIHRLDAALLRLLEERARLEREAGRAFPMAIDDLLARHRGELDAETLRSIAALLTARSQEVGS